MWSMRLVDLFSALSVTASITLHITGIFTCRDIVSQGNVGTRSHIPFLSAALMGGIWAAYGVLVSILSLILVNLFVAVLQTLYFVIFYIYSENVSSLRRDTMIVALLFLVPVLYCYYVFASLHVTTISNVNNNDDGLTAHLVFVMGIVCNVYTVLFFAAPLSSMAEVIKSKETSSMSLPLSIMSAISAMSWTFYGILLRDIFVKVPNLIGFFLSVIQLMLFVLYPGKATAEPLSPSHNPV